MKKTKKILSLLIIAAVLITGICTLSGGTVYSNNNAFDDGKAVTIENSFLKVVFDKESSKLYVTDKKTNYVWRSAIDEDKYDEYDVTGNYWKMRTQSLFSFTYTNMEKNEGKKLKSTLEYIEHTTDAKLNDNSINIEYYFPDLNIGLTVIINVKDNFFEISVPAGKIKETGSFGLVEIEMLPFFGCSRQDEDGYMVYPEGCGSIFEFKNKEMYRQISKLYSFRIYGEKIDNIDDYIRKKEQGYQQAMLPFFGVKIENSAFVSSVTDGEYYSEICFAPSGYMVDLNRIYTRILLREKYDLLLSKVNIEGESSMGMSEVVAERHTKELPDSDFSIRYMFLENENAKYDGMALEYQKMLLEKDMLTDNILSVKDSKEMPFFIDFFMGVTEDRIFLDKYVAMTSFSDVCDIFDEIRLKGIQNISTGIIAWTNKGYLNYPTVFSIDRRIGGKSGLNKLVDYVEKNNIDLFFNVNMVDAYKTNGNFNIKNDVVKTPSLLEVTNNDNSLFILSPAVVFERYLSLIREFKNNSISGIYDQKTGNTVYGSYSEKERITRQQAVKIWQDTASNIKSSIGKLCLNGINQYMIQYADKILELPAGENNLLITDMSIPFIQIVLHGYIPYSSSAGNLHYDFNLQKLKWIEYGCIPYFIITKQHPSEMKYTGASYLFSTWFDDWEGKMVDTYNEFTQNLGSVWNKKIISHSTYKENVIEIKYENGVVILINYNEEETKVDGMTIPAMDYCIIN